jgi:hypothetical protein
MNMDWEKALEVASSITNPTTAVAFIAVLVVMVFLIPSKEKRPYLKWLIGVLVVLGIAPLAASTYLASRGVYHIRVVVLGTDGQPENQAKVTSSAGAEKKQADGNWEFDLAPQARPSDGEVTFYASISDAYLAGSARLTLKDEYFPTVNIQLRPFPQVTIRGTVKDESGKAVAGAWVAVSGHSDTATTDNLGNFSLPSHHAAGQTLSIRAEKGDRVDQETVPAGDDVQLVLKRR